MAFCFFIFFVVKVLKGLVSSDVSWDFETALKVALHERDKLLKENPTLNLLKAKIDETLSATAVFEKNKNAW